MFRKLMSWSGVVALAGLAGCIDSTTVVTVGKTGAGTVVETTYMSKAMQNMMEQMMSGMSGGEAGGAAAKKNPMIQDEAKYRAKAAAMGQGVTFVSAKEVTKADGSMGAQVTYAFQDINTLKLQSDPDAPAPGGGDEGMAPAKTAKAPTTFAFTKGNTPKLTITNPKKEKPAEAVAPAATAIEEKPEPPPEALAQMKQMFDGFRVRMVVKVDGEITKSNATFVEKDPVTGKKQVVTLVDMDIGSLMKDEAVFRKLAAMGQIKDMATAKEKMKEIPGLKFETAEKVDVEFK